eukprot:5687013-Pyramimonas_sp.AAC.1
MRLAMRSIRPGANPWASRARADIEQLVLAPEGAADLWHDVRGKRCFSQSFRPDVRALVGPSSAAWLSVHISRAAPIMGLLKLKEPAPV